MVDSQQNRRKKETIRLNRFKKFSINILRSALGEVIRKYFLQPVSANNTGTVHTLHKMMLIRLDQHNSSD